MKNKLIKAIATAMIVTSMFSTFALSANAAGNINDTIVYKEANQNSGGTPYRSAWRGKWDYTSAYCMNTTTSGGSATVWVHRTNNSKTSSQYTVDRYYGKWSYNGATRNSKTVYRGKYVYLPNYVKEDGYNYAALGYIMNKEGVKYKMWWSPDSV